LKKFKVKRKESEEIFFLDNGKPLQNSKKPWKNKQLPKLLEFLKKCLFHK